MRPHLVLITFYSRPQHVLMTRTRPGPRPQAFFEMLLLSHCDLVIATCSSTFNSSTMYCTGTHVLVKSLSRPDHVLVTYGRDTAAAELERHEIQNRDGTDVWDQRRSEREATLVRPGSFSRKS